MSRRADNPPSRLTGTAVLFVLWIVSLAIVGPLFLGLRRTGYVELLGSRLEGGEAAAAVGILGMIPIALLALALQGLYRHKRQDDQ